MRTLSEVLSAVDSLGSEELETWIAERWIKPGRAGGEYIFSEVDIARVRLISEIHHGLGVERESLSLVLSLLDQLYAVRRRLHALESAVGAESEPVREAIARRCREALAQPAQPSTGHQDG